MYKLLVLFITLIVVVLISIQFGVMANKTDTPITEGATGLANSEIKCGSNKFCVGMVNSKPHCFGDNNGCLWGRNDCQTDEQCKKYNVNSPKYTDNGQCSWYKPGDWPYDACVIKMESLPPSATVSEAQKKYREKATALLRRIETTTGFIFIPINQNGFSNVEAIIQFYKNYFDINLIPIVDRFDSVKTTNDELNNTGEYRKLMGIIKGYKENGINTHDQLIQTLSDIRTTSSAQGFTTRTEGLTELGNLSDAEATCYMNNNPDVLREVAGTIAGVKRSPVPGLKYRVFNSYYGLNLTAVNGGLNFVEWPWGTTSQEYNSYVTRLFPLKNTSSMCGFNSNLVASGNVGNRNYLMPCILKEGTSNSVAHLEHGTRDHTDPTSVAYIQNNNSGSFYTIEWTGYFTPDVDGTWEFLTSSDDGTHLFIYDETTPMENGCPKESERVAGVPGLHGWKGVIRTKQLKGGKSYNLLFLFGENGGGDQVQLLYRCPQSQRASSSGDRWYHASTSIDGSHLFFTLTPGGITTYQKLNQYDQMTLERARNHWNQKGQPNTYTGCSDIAITPADQMNAYTSNTDLQTSLSQTNTSASLKECDATSNLYGTNCVVNPTTVQVYNEKTGQYIASNGILNISGQALPDKQAMTTMREGFVEGLEINENRLNDYFDALQNFGNVNKDNIADVLNSLKYNYKIDISKPENVANFMDPYKRFEIDTLEKLADFRKQMTEKYPNFLSGTTEDMPFIQLMNTLGIKYNTTEYTNLLNTVTDYGIPTYAEMIKFTNNANQKLRINKNPMELIALFKSFNVDKYYKVNGVVATLHSYLYGRGLNQNIPGDTFINEFKRFGVTNNNYNQFMLDNGQIASTDILQHISSFSSFGVMYVMDKSTQTYHSLKVELSKFILPADLTTIPNYITKDTAKLGTTIEQISNTDAKKQALKISLYLTIGVDTFMKYQQLTNDVANKTTHNLSQLVKDKKLHDFFGVDGMVSDNTKDNCLFKLADRFLLSIQLINQVGFTKVCSVLSLFTTLRTNLNMKYTDLEKYMYSNKNLFQTTYSNFVNCGEGFTEYKQSEMATPKIREGLEPANMISTVNTFGIYDNKLAMSIGNNQWKDIPDMNTEFNKFNVRNPDEYKIFTEELKKFGVGSSNMQEYLTFILDFGVEYKDIKDFTIYISKVGVTWATFREFITTLQNFGVRMKYLIQFMCYIYSFGIIYEPSTNSVFYRFLRSMQQNQMDYNTIAPNGKPTFINAMNVFVFLLELGNKKIDCSNPMEIINKSPTIKYVELYFDEGKPTDGRMIPFPLETIIKTVQTIDKNASDFKNATSLNITNSKRPKLFTSYAKVQNNQLILNEDHSDGQLSYRTMYSFLNKVVSSYRGVNKSDMLKRLFMTGFMNDTIPDKEFQTYLTRKTISFNKLAELTDRIESWNKGNNGKSPETLNAYNEVVDMLNMMKIFPVMCIQLLKQYVRGTDFNIPNDPKLPNRELNPKNIRCEPYMKVAYRQEDCPNQTTVLAFTTLQQSQPVPISPTSTISPVQLIQQQQYGGYSSATPLGSSFTINTTLYSAYDGRNQYSSV